MTNATAEQVQHDTNQIVLEGHLSQEPRRVPLPSGDELVTFNLVVRRPDGERHDTIPIAVGPPARRGHRRAPWQPTARTVDRAAHLAGRDRVRVVGFVERRFWREAGQPRTRLQVVAREVLRVRSQAV